MISKKWRPGSGHCAGRFHRAGADGGLYEYGGVLANSETGYVTFYSRTRQKLWMKGETSGNRLRVISALTDCDYDTILYRVFVEGDGLVCHTGAKSCFTMPVAIKTVEAPR